MNTVLSNLTKQEVGRLFHYDPITGVVTRKIQTGNNTRVGATVGTLVKTKRNCYLTVSIGDRQYQLHRIIWLMHYGVWPSGQIDHEDQNGTNNRISNLKDVPQATNLKNKQKYSNNKSGCTGVAWDSNMRKWAATINAEGKRGIRLGFFHLKEDAIRARKIAEAKYAYSKNHGK